MTLVRRSLLEDKRDSEESSSVASYTLRPLANRPRLKEPNPFKGKTLREAREFIRLLELVFALSIDTY